MKLSVEARKLLLRLVDTYVDAMAEADNMPEYLLASDIRKTIRFSLRGSMQAAKAMTPAPAPEVPASVQALRDILDDPDFVKKLRAKLKRRLRSKGGRPGLEGATKRPKVPVSKDDWNICESLAKRISTKTFKPTAAQVASVLISEELKKFP